MCGPATRDTPHIIYAFCLLCLIIIVDSIVLCMILLLNNICLMDRSAYLMAAYRPRCPVLAVTRDLEVARHMQLYRGILPVHFRGSRLSDWTEDLDTRIYRAIDTARERQVS